MRRLLALALLAAPLVACDEDGPQAIDQEVEFTVMTRNIYVGANIDVLMMTPLGDIPVVAAQLWGEIQATDFAARAEALADEIADAQPHLVGLQEVSLFRHQSPGDYLIGNPQAAAQARQEERTGYFDLLNRSDHVLRLWMERERITRAK